MGDVLGLQNRHIDPFAGFHGDVVRVQLQSGDDDRRRAAEVLADVHSGDVLPVDLGSGRGCRDAASVLGYGQDGKVVDLVGYYGERHGLAVGDRDDLARERVVGQEYELAVVYIDEVPGWRVAAARILVVGSVEVEHLRIGGQHERGSLQRRRGVHQDGLDRGAVSCRQGPGSHFRDRSRDGDDALGLESVE